MPIKSVLTRLLLKDSEFVASLSYRVNQSQSVLQCKTLSERKELQGKPVVNIIKYFHKV